MGVLARPIARARLRGVNPIYDRVSIVVTSSTVSTQFDTRAPIVSPSNGTPVRWARETGDTVLVSTRVQAGRLVQCFRGRDAGRENVFTLSPDGLTLGVAVTVSSSRLPRPLSYHLV